MSEQTVPSLSEKELHFTIGEMKIALETLTQLLTGPISEAQAQRLRRIWDQDTETFCFGISHEAVCCAHCGAFPTLTNAEGDCKDCADAEGSYDRFAE